MAVPSENIFMGKAIVTPMYGIVPEGWGLY
jgi:hypothetical protein